MRIIITTVIIVFIIAINANIKNHLFVDGR